MHCGHTKGRNTLQTYTGEKRTSQNSQTKALREQKSDVSFKRNATESQKNIAPKQHKDLLFLS